MGKDHATVQNNLGFCYKTGYDVNASIISCYGIAADQGDLDATDTFRRLYPETGGSGCLLMVAVVVLGGMSLFAL